MKIPTGIKVALNDEQNLFCTITFQHVIDEKQNIYMPVKGVYYEVAFINHLESISFIVQSAPCAVTNVGEQRGTYILKPLSMKGNLTAEKNENDQEYH